MRVICAKLFQSHHQQMTKILISLCKQSTDIYNFNILRIITIIYHIYIECELYNLVYKKPSYFVELELINSTMGHCKDQYSFKRKVNIIYDFYL